MHEKHLAYINDKNDAAKKSAYTTLRSTVQKKLRGMTYIHTYIHTHIYT